ncbi:hypothetical protein LZK98_00115 [Sphingomonas cannabina]|uniref:hypothetical protein n=1 Tax=Sphingomonas cannabina TaxID=2899123 RepID=UPI001F402909|nr:hypothetical protein [Sphingomonas cannabina]UIJ45410.1 hypothetical protein LZK98_00115 [Sphingomonas cannabina]
MRKLLGVIAGIVAAMLVIFVVEMIGHWIAPPPASLDMTDKAALAVYVEGVPLALKLLVALAWFLGALVGGHIALRIAGWPPATWIVAVVIAAGGIANVIQLPSPVWMQAAAVLAPLLGGWAALHVPGWRKATAIG